MRTVRIKIYKFDELSQEAQEQALVNFVQMIVSGPITEDDPYYPAVLEMERMQTPWFLGETLFHDYKNQLIDDLRINDYDFTADGVVYPSNN